MYYNSIRLCNNNFTSVIQILKIYIFWASNTRSLLSYTILLGHRLGNVLIDLQKLGVSVHPYLRTSVRPSIRSQSFSDLALMWRVGMNTH